MYELLHALIERLRGIVGGGQCENVNVSTGFFSKDENDSVAESTPASVPRSPSHCVHRIPKPQCVVCRSVLRFRPNRLISRVDSSYTRILTENNELIVILCGNFTIPPTKFSGLSGYSLLLVHELFILSVVYGSRAW